MQTATKGQIRGIKILSDVPVQSKEFLQSSRGEPVHVRRCFHRLRSPKKDSPASAGHFFCIQESSPSSSCREPSPTNILRGN